MRTGYAVVNSAVSEVEAVFRTRKEAKNYLRDENIWGNLVIWKLKGNQLKDYEVSQESKTTGEE